MRKNSRQSVKDKKRILAAINLLSVVDRTLLHALLPDISYGTISGRIVDLENHGLLQWAGHVTRNITEMRRSMYLPHNWNPVAASDAPLKQGDQTTKSYVKTGAWTRSTAKAAMEGK